MGHRANQTKMRSGLIAALDVGTTKVCCFIARAGGDKGIRIIGIGHQVSQGLRSGTIVDMDDAREMMLDTTSRLAKKAYKL